MVETMKANFYGPWGAELIACSVKREIQQTQERYESQGKTVNGMAMTDEASGKQMWPEQFPYAMTVDHSQHGQVEWHVECWTEEKSR